MRDLIAHRQAPPAAIGGKPLRCAELGKGRARIAEVLQQGEAVGRPRPEVLHQHAIVECLACGDHARQHARDLELRAQQQARQQGCGDQRKEEGENLIGQGLVGVYAQRACRHQCAQREEAGAGEAPRHPQPGCGNGAERPV